MKEKRAVSKKPKASAQAKMPPVVKTEGRVRRLANAFKNMAFKGRYEKG